MAVNNNTAEGLDRMHMHIAEQIGDLMLTIQLAVKNNTLDTPIIRSGLSLKARYISVYVKAMHDAGCIKANTEEEYAKALRYFCGDFYTHR